MGFDVEGSMTAVAVAMAAGGQRQAVSKKHSE